jgi:hypothetical protein
MVLILAASLATTGNTMGKAGQGGPMDIRLSSAEASCHDEVSTEEIYESDGDLGIVII